MAALHDGGNGGDEGGGDGEGPSDSDDDVAPKSKAIWGGNRLAYPHWTGFGPVSDRFQTSFRPVSDQCHAGCTVQMSQSLSSPMPSPNVIRVMSDAQSTCRMHRTRSVLSDLRSVIPDAQES